MAKKSLCLNSASGRQDKTKTVWFFNAAMHLKDVGEHLIDVDAITNSLCLYSNTVNSKTCDNFIFLEILLIQRVPI